MTSHLYWQGVAAGQRLDHKEDWDGLVGQPLERPAADRKDLEASYQGTANLL